MSKTGGRTEGSREAEELHHLRDGRTFGEILLTFDILTRTVVGIAVLATYCIKSCACPIEGTWSLACLLTYPVECIFILTARRTSEKNQRLSSCRW